MRIKHQTYQNRKQRSSVALQPHISLLVFLTLRICFVIHMFSCPYVLVSGIEYSLFIVTGDRTLFS